MSEQRQLRRAIKRIPLKRKGFDSFLDPGNLSQIHMPHCVGDGAPVNRAPDGEDAAANFAAIQNTAGWALLLGEGAWEDAASVKELRRGAKEIRKLARSIVVACDDRLEALDDE